MNINKRPLWRGCYFRFKPLLTENHRINDRLINDRYRWITTPFAAMLRHLVSPPQIRYTMRVHKILLATSLFFTAIQAYCQNVGIGTTSPEKLLSVAGSIAVDHDNQNSGTLDSAALVFGSSALVGITSNKMPGFASTNGLEFWTAGTRRMFLTEDGRLSLGSSYPEVPFKLHVAGHVKSESLHSNNIYISANGILGGSLEVGNNIGINGPPYANIYGLTVNNKKSWLGGETSVKGPIYADGDIKSNQTLIGENVSCSGKVFSPAIQASQMAAIGGQPDPNYKLRVYSGNTRLGGDVVVLGTLTADEVSIDKINGKGVVRSNGNSSLRVGFDYCWLNHTLSAGNQTDVTANISEFSGGPNDVRVFVSQFDPDPLPQYVNWHDFTFHIHSVNPVNNTCKVRITNTTNGNLSIRGYLYLTSIAKD